jgi:hypothetical protein
MMTKLLNLELRSSLKNVFKKLFRSLHSAGTLKKQYTIKISAPKPLPLLNCASSFSP